MLAHFAQSELTRLPRWLAVFLPTLIVLWCATQSAHVGATGTVIMVNTAIDELNRDGNCSLREAIRAANLDTAVDGCLAGNGDDTIFVPAGIYTLTLTGSNEDNAATGDL